MTKLRLGYSSCPNDTFIFDALVNQKIDTEGLEFEVIMEDVEALNERAFNSELDVTKLSYHAFAHLTDSYTLLSSGSALGRGCGPLVISKPGNVSSISEQSTVSIPGRYTTANFLFSIFYPSVNNKSSMVFSEIEDSVLSEKNDFGVIIHENRFTYADRGLEKVTDLGEQWESKTGLPIPLGGIVAKKELDIKTIDKIDRVLNRSIRFAFDNPDDSNEYVFKHAQEMSKDAVKNHIELYVNQYTLSLGEEGLKAVESMLVKAVEVGAIDDFNKDFYIK